MDQTLQKQTVFHLTGRRPSAGLEPVAAGAVRPALMARYRDLTKLRYDFPLVLVKGADKEFARSLSSIIDALLKEITRPGIEGEGLRRYALHVEHEIRCSAASGKPEMLSVLWKRAVARLTRQASGPRFVDFLAKAGKALRVDGLVVDCDEQLPVRLVEHAWRVSEERKARGVRAEINTLIARLNDILRADFVRSDAGRKPESLKAGVGIQHQQLIDFNAMSKMLRQSGPSQRLPDARRRRIEWALEVLRSQRFFATPGNGRAPEAGKEPYGFAFSHGADVIEAFRQRLPAMVELVKAMSLAALEADGRYVAATHDAFFEAFDEGALTERDLGMFPHYLVCLAGGRSQAAQVSLMDLLSSGVPVKVLVQVDDILEESGLGEAHFAVGLRSVQLATMAVGLTNCFVLQSASSSLPRVRHALERGLAYAGPALFSVFSPKAAGRDGVPAYLVSAAAMQSRAFPVFTCDPSAGPDLADRFSLDDNVDPTVDWPVTQFSYADADLQRQVEPLAFTFADFVSCDARHARHFAAVPHADWSDNMVPVADWLVNPPKPGSDRVPYILAVGPDDVLQRVIVDDKVIQATRRCRENWHRLQELGGVHSSHAERLLKREKAAWEAEKAREIEAIRASATPAAALAPEASAIVLAQAQPAAAPAAVQAPEEPARSPDEAYVETPRCSTCNECTLINDQMFAYNENKQAYIKDIKAGTYRQLVEAAESCQVSIIHPGKPRDPNEPGLEELIERAKPFQ